jgi:DNA (cytosine-5)-methyltransferase 1
VSDLPAISLFSGAGGLDLGVESAGYSVKVAVEHEVDAAETLRRNFTETVVLEADITQLKTRTILSAARLRKGEAELLVGGPPCTPFSKSGYWLEYKRNGDDPDASLLDEYLRVLDEARPRTFILENVFGLAYRNHNASWYARLLQRCLALKYKLAAEVLLAADHAVPQKRQRVFVVGSLDRTPEFPEPSHTGPHETRKQVVSDLPQHVTSGDAIGDLANRADLREPEEDVNGKYGHLLPAIPEGDNYLYYTAKRGHPKPLFEWRTRYWSFLLKLSPDRAAPTIQAQPGPYVGPFHWDNRRLRLPEIKRLQTFPDDYEIVGTRRSAQVQIGNAVPPLLAERVASALHATG